MGLFIMGKTTFLPIYFLYRSSSGFTATAVSPNIVSGRVVATISPSVSEPSIKYLMCQKKEFSSTYSTSASESAVRHSGHQLIILLP